MSVFINNNNNSNIEDSDYHNTDNVEDANIQKITKLIGGYESELQKADNIIENNSKELRLLNDKLKSLENDNIALKKKNQNGGGKKLFKFLDDQILRLEGRNMTSENKKELIKLQGSTINNIKK